MSNIDNTIVRVKNSEEAKKAVEWFKSKGIDTRSLVGEVGLTSNEHAFYGVHQGTFVCINMDTYNKHIKELDVLEMSDIEEKTFPRVMLVTNKLYEKFHPRWIIAKHGNYYISVGDTDCERIALLSVNTYAYRYAEEMPREVEVTIDEIAKWKGVHASLIKIIK